MPASACRRFKFLTPLITTQPNLNLPHNVYSNRMTASRFVKIAMRDGKTIAINMRNVLSVQQQALNVVISYNATHSNGSGFAILGNGFYIGGGTTVTQEFTYQCEKDAKYAFENLINELQ